MKAEGHEVFRRMIEESLVGVASIGQEQELREHLRSCAACQQYLEANARVIAGLGGFSFEVAAGAQERVLKALRVRAEQEASPAWDRRRLVMVCLVAVALTVSGSVLELQAGGVAAAFFGVQREQVRGVMVAFWIVPSLCTLLLFPVLPLLSRSRKRIL